MPRPILYNRTAALASATTLFWEKGFHGTSLKELEAAMEMKPGSIYTVFSNKEKLYSSAMQRYFESAQEALRAEIAEAESPLQGLVSHIKSYATLPGDHPQRQLCMLTRTIIDTEKTKPELAAQARQHLVSIRAEIADAFDQAKSVGELPEEIKPEHLARRFQSNLNALRIELSQGIDTNDLNVLVEEMAQEIKRLVSADRK